SSLFVGDESTWIPTAVDDLYARVVEHPDFSKGADFAEKLRGQLDQATRQVVLLAAELLYVLLLPQASGASAKRDAINSVLAVASSPVELPDDLATALGHGVADYGAAFSYRYWQYVFLLEFARVWVRLDTNEQSHLLSDADAFREMVFGLPEKG